MSARYWVGGTDTWNNTAGTKWALQSGEPGGWPVPTSSDDVYFDGNSGSGTVTVASTGGGTCHNLDFTDFTGTFRGSGGQDTNVYGSLTLGSLMTYNSVSTHSLKLLSTAPETITSNGKIINNSVYINGAGGSYTLADDFSTSGGLYTMNSASLNANNKNVTIGALIASNANGFTLKMGSGLWIINGAPSSFFFLFDAPATTSNLTIYPEESTLKITSGSGQPKYIQLGGYTFHNLWISTSGSGDVVLTDNGTFNKFIVSSSTHGIKVEAGTTITANTFSINGIGGSSILLYSATPGVHFHLNKTSGVVVTDYVTVTDCYAEGGARWYMGSHSTSVSGNSGWTSGNYKNVPPPFFNT